MSKWQISHHILCKLIAEYTDWMDLVDNMTFHLSLCLFLRTSRLSVGAEQKNKIAINFFSSPYYLLLLLLLLLFYFLPSFCVLKDLDKKCSDVVTSILMALEWFRTDAYYFATTSTTLTTAMAGHCLARNESFDFFFRLMSWK